MLVFTGSATTAWLDEREISTIGAPATVVESLLHISVFVINYLAVRGREIRIFGGLVVRTQADWKHREDLMTRVFQLMHSADG